MKHTEENHPFFGLEDLSVSRKEAQGIAIDPRKTLLREDAMWAEPTYNGFLVEVSIADISGVLNYEDSISQEIIREFLYCQRDTFSNRISLAKTLNLATGKDHLVTSVSIDLDSKFNMHNIEVQRKIIKKVICLNSQDFSIDPYKGEIKEAIKTVKHIAENLSYKRAGTKMSDKNMPRLMVNELMILCNQAILRCMKKMNKPFLHAPYDPRSMSIKGRWKTWSEENEGSHYTKFTSPFRNFIAFLNHFLISGDEINEFELVRFAKRFNYLLLAKKRAKKARILKLKAR